MNVKKDKPVLDDVLFGNQFREIIAFVNQVGDPLIVGISKSGEISPLTDKDGIYSKQEITNRIMETLDINNDKNKDHIHDFIYEVVEQVILMISRGTDTDPNIYKLINWHGKL